MSSAMARLASSVRCDHWSRKTLPRSLSKKPRRSMNSSDARESVTVSEHGPNSRPNGWSVVIARSHSDRGFFVVSDLAVTLGQGLVAYHDERC